MDTKILRSNGLVLTFDGRFLIKVSNYNTSTRNVEYIGMSDGVKRFKVIWSNRVEIISVKFDGSDILLESIREYKTA